MANLKSDPSEWEVGTSDPDEFTADAVAQVVKNEETSDEEVARIKSEDERATVQSAVEERESADDGDKNDGSDSNNNPAANTQTDPTPGEESEKNQEGDTGAEDEEDEDDEDVDLDDLPDPHADGYSANSDPSVPSSVVAENVMRELEGLGKSPTLDACREAYKENGGKSLKG